MSESPETQQRVVKVLLVDDDHDSLATLCEVLQRHYEGAVVDACESGQEAEARIDATDYDIMVCDIKAPGLDRVEWLAQTRKLRRHTPTLLVTWHDEHDLAVQALRGGAYEYVRKPIDPDLFLAAFESALEMRQCDRQGDKHRQTLERYASALERNLIKLRQEAAVVKLLQEIAVEASTSRSLNDVLRICLNGLGAYTGWPVGHVWLPAADGTGALVSAGLWHLDDPERYQEFRQETESRRFGPGDGLPGRALASGAATWMRDVINDPACLRARTAKDAGLRAGFAFPVLARGELVAVLEFFSMQSAEADVALLAVVAYIEAQVGQAVERMRDRIALQESEARFRSLAQSATDGIVSADSQGNIVFWNRGAQSMFGHAEQDVLGKPLTFLMPERYRDAHQAGLKRLSATGQSKLIGKTVELCGLRKDGTEFPLELSLASWNTAEGLFYTGIIRDIGERKRVEEQIRRLNEELHRQVIDARAANKELEAFSYTVSHDLRAPVRAVAGFARILLEDYAAALPEQAARYLQLVRDNAGQMGQLIDDMLTFSRLSRLPIQKQLVDPAEIVRHVLDSLQQEHAERRITVSVGVLPSCQADPALLKQVYMNLLGNAFKYTRRCEHALIEVGCTADGQDSREQIYFVKDNGVGFDMQYAEKLFGVFQRLHRAEEYEGTGVGLAIVERIVHRHGGRVWAEAEVNRGATFYFSLEAGCVQ